MIHLDTHVIAWLYDGEVERLPRSVQAALEANDLLISPMVQLELEYLHDIGRLAATSSAILDDLNARIGLRLSSAPFAKIIEHAARLSWTRDPFDRIIVATAIADDLPLLTKDETILEHCALAGWDDTAPARSRAPSRRRAKKRPRR
ncbi:MAG TPA: PIN domain-containing protein [Polyangiaceae bacterium]